MPILKQSAKRARQVITRTVRNRQNNHRMKSLMKLILGYVKSNEKEKALELLPEVLSVIDTCRKKKIIYKNNASRKKSRMQKAVKQIPDGAPKKTVKTVKTVKKEKK